MIQEKEQLNLQIAEMSILARIKQDEGAQDQQEGTAHAPHTLTWCVVWRTCACVVVLLDSW